MPAFLDNLLVFGRMLRSLGLDVHLRRLLDVIEALSHVDVASRDDVYHTCRTLLVQRREDLAAFDRAFDTFWAPRRHTTKAHNEDAPRRHEGTPRRNEDTKGSREDGPRRHEGTKGNHEDGPRRHEGTKGNHEDGPRRHEGTKADHEDAPRRHEDRPRRHEGTKGRSLEGEGGGQDEGPVAGAIGVWSDVARIAAKDFSAFTADEIALAQAAFDRLEWTPDERRTRRWVAGRGPRLDVRRALAASVRTGGDVVRLPRRRRRTRARPVVILCDISGSMERYSRLLLHFAYAMGRRHPSVEAFVFSTGLTRITSALRTRRLNDAVSAVSSAVPDWSGGTRIGDALRRLHQQWSRRVLHRGPLVLLISDGWDRGDPDLLREEIGRLRRSCHRLIWLNPLIGTEGYTPLTRGLQAALPFVDDFLPARTLTNLADLAIHLNTLQRRTTWTSPARTRSMRRPIASGRSS